MKKLKYNWVLFANGEGRGGRSAPTNLAASNGRATQAKRVLSVLWLVMVNMARPNADYIRDMERNNTCSETSSLRNIPIVWKYRYLSVYNIFKLKNHFFYILSAINYKSFLCLNRTYRKLIGVLRKNKFFSHSKILKIKNKILL